MLRKTFAPDKFFGGLEKLLRKIFAPDEILGGLGKMKESNGNRTQMGKNENNRLRTEGRNKNRMMNEI